MDTRIRVGSGSGDLGATTICRVPILGTGAEYGKGREFHALLSPSPEGLCSALGTPLMDGPSLVLCTLETYPDLRIPVLLPLSSDFHLDRFQRRRFIPIGQVAWCRWCFRSED